MTTSFDIHSDVKTAHRVCAGFGMRTGRVGSPVAVAIAGGAAITHGLRTTDGNLHALAARCAG